MLRKLFPTSSYPNEGDRNQKKNEEAIATEKNEEYPHTDLYDRDLTLINITNFKFVINKSFIKKICSSKKFVKKICQKLSKFLSKNSSKNS